MHTPAVRLSLPSSLDRRAFHREEMEAEGQLPCNFLIKGGRKPPELSSFDLYLPSECSLKVNAKNFSPPAPLKRTEMCVAVYCKEQ